MKKPAKSILNSSVISKIFIIAGGLCLALSILYAACDFPWFTINNEHANELELQDPLPPDFDYIEYKDVALSDSQQEPQLNQESSLNQDDIQVSPDTELLILPGEDATESSAHTAAQEEEYDTSKYLLLGVVKIPRINIAENLFEGAGEQMKAGIGHVEGTAMPGEPGNSVIAGHRVSSFGKHPFRYLNKMKSGDVITIKFNEQTFTYEVFDTFIVTKYDVWVLEPAEDETHLLTLVTCDPVISSVSRPNRLIVRARLTLADEFN